MFKRLGFLLFLSEMWLCVKLIPLLTGDKLTLTNLDNEQKSNDDFFFFHLVSLSLTGFAAADTQKSQQCAYSMCAQSIPWTEGWKEETAWKEISV